MLMIPLLVAATAGCHRGAKPDAKAEHAEVAPIPVTTTQAALKPVSKELLVNGTIIAKSQVNVLPKTSGRIIELKVAEGDRVTQGQVIARLETPELGWQLQQQKSGLISAEANLDQAEDNHTRMKELAAEGVISQQQLKGAETQVKVARSQLKQAKAAISLMESQLANGTVTSPISGIVVAKGLDMGAMAGPNASIVTIAQAGDLQVKLPIAERDLSVVREGGRVVITSVALPGESFDGRITEIAPMVDPQTRLIPVKVDLERNGRLKVGMNVSAAIAGPSHQGLTIPTGALITDGAEQIVFLARGGKAVRTPVITGVRGKDWAEISEGLTSGDQVVVKGSAFVKEGADIKPEGGAR
jgi:RND family efflux transporter MFP subunit